MTAIGQELTLESIQGIRDYSKLSTTGAIAIVHSTA